MKTVFNILKILFISGFILYLISLLAVVAFQEKLIFMPESLPQDYQYDFKADFEEVFLEADDGAELNALHFKATNPNGVVLYYHGNAGELASWGRVVQKFVSRNYDVLVMDYRTYGKSTGKLSERAMYSDAQMFYDYVSERYSEDKIVVYGRSLGTTFATYVASINNPKKLILEAPFYSLEDVARSRLSIYPVKWFLKYRFPTHRFIPNVNTQIIIFHGTDDNMVGYDNSIKLSEIINPEKLNFYTIPNAGHNDLEGYVEYIEGLDAVL